MATTRLNQNGFLFSSEFDEVTRTNISISGLGTFYSTEFSENVGIATNVSGPAFPAYNIFDDEFAGVLFGLGQGTLMRHNQDASVVIYNEIDEVTSI